MSMMTPRTRATLQVGDKGSFTKTITERDVFAFADATGDFNTLHIDEEYARRTVLPVTSYKLQITKSSE